MRSSCHTLLLLLLCTRNALLSGSTPFWRRSRRPQNSNNIRSKWSLQSPGMVMKWGKLLFRGGTSPDDDTLPEVENEQQSPMDILTPNSARREDIHAVSKPRKSRHTFDMILDLRKRSSVSGNDESLALRKLITSRANDYFLDLQESVDANENKLPHPTKLLHYLAPKVPAIKQSPDVNLRIHSAKSDMDSGVAACIIGTLAHACEIYDKEIIKRSETEKPKSSAPEITTDRRFEQLVECVLSGVNVKKRKRESLMRRLEKNSEGTTNIEEILDEEDAQEDEGLKSRDACRAAWGIAVLGAYHLDTLGDVKVLDLLLALSLRIRESLLARLQLLRQDDLLSDTSDTTTEERMEELAEELAEDAVSAMWTFACVKACTGMRSVPLFETCCSILCQNPVEMRRRAQEAVDYENVHPNIGTSDVIDRLARSEAEVEVAPENSTKIDNSVEDGTEKDTLLDWLSPTEVNDMLWALALHGSSNSSSASDENILSETASTLREIAFDRILDWLQQDLKPSVENDEDKIALGDQPMSVEVVDAATLLSSQGPSSTNSTNDLIETMSIEDITLNSLVTGNGADIQEVEVVDAAALLASMKKDGPVDVETEVIMAPTTALDSVDTAREEANSASGAKIAGSYDEPESVYSKPNTTFSPHDLASMAWSVTELRDPLKIRIVGMVVKLITGLGSTSIKQLTGGDLANLVWAVSKYEDELTEEDSNRPSLLSLTLVRWVAQSAHQRVVESYQDVAKGVKFDALQVFQPPELGRLLWAIAYTMSTYWQVPDKMRKDPRIHELARFGLEAAASHLSLFATEDLVRISWAFLELCGTEAALSDVTIGVSLGRILATVEQSLHRWEQGECQNPTFTNSLSSDTSVFSSFFGKPRLSSAILEQMISDHDDEDEVELASLLEKSHRPKLRDLSVDPSNLCKAACVFQRLSAKHPHISGGWTLTRVAVRLMASKGARLMKECSIHDIVRLSEAAALSEVDGHGRELITGLFAHKAVQVLNEALDSGRKMGYDSVNIAEASPSEICTLLWALGELGVKHSSYEESRHSAHKKLRMVADVPLLTKDQVNALDVASAIKLCRGVIRMKYCSSDPIFVVNVLKAVQKKTSNLQGTDDLCALAESISMLKESLKAADTTRHTNIDSNTDENAEQHKDQSFETPVDVTLTPEDDSSVPLDYALVNQELKLSCDAILQSITLQAKETAEKFSSVEIRRLLVVYSFLPFQADDFIDCLDREVSFRLSYQKRSSNASLESLIKNAKSKSVAVNSTIFGDASSSRFGSFKNGILSLFRNSDSSETSDENTEENNLTEELASLIQESIASTSDAAKQAEEFQTASRTSLDSILKRLGEGSSFELGRCQELIESYRRIEFSTGTRRSRYDKERRKDIAKRVLSRLLP